MADVEYVPIGYAVRVVGLSREWLVTLCDRGDVDCVRDPYGRRSIPLAEVRRLTQDRGVVVDHERVHA